MKVQPITHYSVVYSWDAPNVEGRWFRRNCNPPVEQIRKWNGEYRLWELTERGHSDDLGVEDAKEWTHRKWAALLTPKQFRDFLDHCDLYPDTTETMGTIGAPGFGFGHVPAINFEGNDEAHFASCYVTPVPFWLEFDGRQGTLPMDGLEGWEFDPEKYWRVVREWVIAFWDDPYNVDEEMLELAAVDPDACLEEVA